MLEHLILEPNEEIVPGITKNDIEEIERKINNLPQGEWIHNITNKYAGLKGMYEMVQYNKQRDKPYQEEIEMVKELFLEVKKMILDIQMKKARMMGHGGGWKN